MQLEESTKYCTCTLTSHFLFMCNVSSTYSVSQFMMAEI